MNLGHLLFVITISSIVLAGCSPKHKEGALLPIRETGTIVRWDGPHRLDEASYYIDGVKVGVGLKGFDAIMRHLSRLEAASSVKIQMPHEWSKMGYDGKVDLWWEFPFGTHVEQEREFTKLCGEKSLHLSFETFEGRTGSSP